MKCDFCNKKLEVVGIVDGVATWFGKYVGVVCTKRICLDCIKDPKKKEKYING